MGKDTHEDNLVTYTDGHVYCFSCGYYSSSIYKRNNEQSLWKGYPTLPKDTVGEIDALGLSWLAKYGIVRDELTKFDIRWSPSKKWLIFPVYSGTDILLMYQAKTFEGPAKYLTFGSPESIINILAQKERDKNLVLVEDMLSAIKVSRQTSSMPLWGSSIGPGKFGRLQFSRSDNLIFWLDHDKRKESLILATRSRQYGFTSSVLVTEKDPKEYNDKEIAEFLSSCFTGWV